MATIETGTYRNARIWRLTAFSGLALLVLVTVHMVAHHFVVESTGGLRDYAAVLDYVSNPLIVAVESTFLVAVTLHAMLGLRGILLDLGPGARTRRLIDRGLFALGAATLLYGFVLIGVLASRA